MRGLDAHVLHRLDALRQVLHLHRGDVQCADVALGEVLGQRVREVMDDDAVVHLCLRQPHLG